LLKVKEYLDKTFYVEESKLIPGKPKGCYGSWTYPKNFEMCDTKHKNYKLSEDGKSMVEGEGYQQIPKFAVQCSCNNQTMLFRLIINKEYQSTRYRYLQTYEHISRGEPDEYGYCRRSTDEEVIRHIKWMKKQVDVALKLERIDKLERIIK